MQEHTPAATSPRPMSDRALSSLVAHEITRAGGNGTSPLAHARAENMRYYLGEKFGNEIEGRSQAVSTDVADTVDWILPQLMRAFAGSARVVRFEPSGPEDQRLADQATDYVNYVWSRDNPGFLTFYTWFKDALIAKTGILKIWWQDEIETERTDYRGLTEAGRIFLCADADAEAIAETAYLEGEAVRYDVTVLRRKTRGRIRVAPVPPEEFLIAPDARTIADACFVAHRRRRALSDLVAEGHDAAMLRPLASDHTLDLSPEALSRRTYAGEGDRYGSGLDPAMRDVTVTEAYLRVDYDGDGIAELRQVIVAGEGALILRNEPWDGPLPFVGLTPIPMPHRFVGRAVADLVKDVQLIKSTILRQYLDALYLANNPRQEAVEANIVDPAELLTARPGGIVRVRAPGSIQPIQTPFIGSAALEGLQYVDQIRENRTGVSPRTQGLGTSSLHQTATGERLLLSAAQSKVELIIRVFAETGVKEAFRLILWLAVNRARGPRTIRLGEAWATIHPQSFDPDMDVSIAVGLGVSDRDQQLAHATTLLSLQTEAIKLGIARPENLLETAELILQAMGLEGVERFFSRPPVPAAPDPRGKPLATSDFFGKLPTA